MKSTAITVVLAICCAAVLSGIRAASPAPGDPPADWTLSGEAGEALTAYSHTNVGMMFLTWPQSYVKHWSAPEIPEACRKEALTWIRRVLRDDVVPADLAERLIGIRCRVQEEFAGVPSSVKKPPSREIDEIWVRYEVRNVKVQICDTQRGMAILVEPLDQKPPATMGWLEAPQYVLKVYGRAFKMPRIPLQHASLYLQKYGDETPIYCGVLKLDPNKDHWIGTDNALHFGRAPDALRYWHDEISVVTDGPKVGFIFSKVDGEPDEMFTKPRPSPPSGTRW